MNPPVWLKVLLLFALAFVGTWAMAQDSLDPHSIIQALYAGILAIAALYSVSPKQTP